MVDDFKRDGLWVQSFRLNGKKTNTRSGQAWYAIHARKTDSAYDGVTVDFTDFQSFASWYMTQPGYLLGWEVDKDLLGGRTYSSDNCVLLPKSINNAIRYKNPRNPALPPGVGSSGKKFRAYFCNKHKFKHLGYFDTPEEAFVAYKQDKEQYVKELAEQYKDMLCCRSYAALLKFNVAY